MSLDLHPVSASETKVQSPVAWFPSNVYHAYDIKNDCAAARNFFAAFFAMCTAIQLRGNIGYGPLTLNLIIAIFDFRCLVVLNIGVTVWE